MTEKTTSQLIRMLNKVSAKFPKVEEPTIMTDIHIRTNQETGDVMVFDDNDEEVTRIVVDEWIENQQDSDAFYKDVAKELRRLLFAPVNLNGSTIETGQVLGIVMPYSYVLETETGDSIEELYIADEDQDTVVVGEPFMVGLSEELDDFIKDLLNE